MIMMLGVGIGCAFGGSVPSVMEAWSDDNAGLILTSSSGTMSSGKRGSFMALSGDALVEVSIAGMWVLERGEAFPPFKCILYS
jgi:hypothetical protein